MTLLVRATLSSFSRILALAAALTGIAPTALAEDNARASRAEELFREGKSLLAERDYARACPLLAASFDLDPGTGTLLALAICHEGEGKLASASAEYKDAAQRAKSEGRADRERVARDRALALAPRLSTLAITPLPEAWKTADFVVRRSGVVVERGVWNTPVPLDGGEYVIEASASGKKPWRAQVTVAASAEQLTLTIPSLENLAPVVSTAPVDPAASPPPAESDPPTNQKERPGGKRDSGAGDLTVLQYAGIGGMVVGAVGILLGGAYAVDAMNKYEDSNQNGCNGDTCVGQGKEDRLAARSAGNTATVCFAIGGALAVGGVVAFVLGGPSDDAAATRTLPLNPRVSIESRAVGVSLGGSF